MIDTDVEMLGLRDPVGNLQAEAKLKKLATELTRKLVEEAFRAGQEDMRQAFQNASHECIDSQEYAEQAVKEEKA